MDFPLALTRLRRATAWPNPPDAPWRTARFCVVDIETTGLNMSRDEIVSVGVVEIREARITPDTFYEVAKPARAISEESMCIHSLTSSDLLHAPPFAEVMPRLRETLAESVIVAHAAWVERCFLNRALRPLGEKVPDRLVDTAALARFAGISHPGPNEPSLEGLSRSLGLPVHTPHHALGDAQTTAQLMLALASRIEREVGRLTVNDLLDISAAHGN